MAPGDLRADGADPPPQTGSDPRRRGAPALRLFVALPVPAEVCAEIQNAVAALPARARPDGLRWVKPDAWHLTLTFCGSVAPRHVGELQERLGRAARRTQPLNLAIGSAGRFGRQVIWAGVMGDSERLSRLAACTTAAARRTGIDVSARPYRPHLTLARSDGRADLRSVVTELASIQSAPWTASELRLVRSTLGAGLGRTAHHEVVERWPLGRPAGPQHSGAGALDCPDTSPADR